VPFETGEPQTLAEIVAAFERLQGASEDFLAPLPLPVFFAAQGEAGEKWSPAEHVRHLIKSTVPVARALALPRLFLRVGFGAQRAPSLPFAALREVYRGKLAAGGTAGRFAPSQRPLPADPGPWRDEILRRQAEAGALFAKRARRWHDRDLDRCRLPHPLLGPLSLREMLFFTVYHTAHHLNLVESRLQQVRLTPEPGG
jgi:hypothetical protein